MYKWCRLKGEAPTRVEGIEIKQYRNIDKLELPCGDETYLFVGENAQGKTNILEALYILALGKSHRTRSHKDLIQIGKSEARLTAKVKRGEQQASLQVCLNEKGKRMSINGIEQSRISQYIGSFPVVMFSPEDLELVKGSPQVRRRFIDTEIGQISPTYVHNLSQCNKVTLQRNHLLKELSKKRVYESDLLDVLTCQFVDLSTKIWKKRYYFIQALVTWAKEIHQDITAGRDDLEIHYVPSISIQPEMDLAEMKDLLWSELKKIRHKEVMRGSTLIGPHRDDLGFRINSHPLLSFGSQGQQRTAALSAKLAGLELIKQEMGIYPILLLDDVLSELDDLRKTQLLDTIYHRVQTFVTSTTVDGIDPGILEKAHIYHVQNGTVTKHPR